MQVRVFESENMDSALRQIKEALGPDALILSSRTVRKGGMGLFGKPMLEVTAAIDPTGEEPASLEAVRPARRADPAARVIPPTPSPQSTTLSTQAGVEADDVSYQEIWNQPATDIPATKPVVSNPYVQPVASDYHIKDLHSEVGELRQLITTLVKDLPGQIEKVAKIQPQVASPVFHPTFNAGIAGQPVANQPLLDALTNLGVESDAANTIAHYAASQLTTRQMNDPAVLNAFLGKTIAELVQTTGDILPELGSQKRIALIGPTGVGKTTTIAKLAAAYLLSGGKRVALVTIDTYRIAAVEQLKVYGEIMNLPVEVVISAEQLREVLQRHSNKDLILIDTAGRSPKDNVSLNELQEFLCVDEAIEPHLVMSATTRERDLYEIYNRFSVLNPQSLLMTKLDECDSLGVLLNIHLRNNCPLSYLANGQKVPEDLVQANAELVSALILENGEG